MPHPAYEGLKGQAYGTLASVASCDHAKAQSMGYANGWQLLMDKHDGNEMALFCSALPKALSEAQCRTLLDGLAKEFAGCESWGQFVEASCEHPHWKPSQGPAPRRTA